MMTSFQRTAVWLVAAVSVTCVLLAVVNHRNDRQHLYPTSQVTMVNGAGSADSK